MDGIKKKIYNKIYLKIKKIGQGSGGKIILCQLIDKIKTKQNFFGLDQGQNNKQNIDLKYVVLKKFLNQSDDKLGINYDMMHELKFMKGISHKNIINVLDVFLHKKQQQRGPDLINVVMVMDFYLVLNDLVFDKLGINEKLSIMKQILQGMNFLHKQWIIHRDIKVPNILIDKDGVVKIADFGLAREHGSPLREMSPQIVTRNYRPPELLFDAKLYGSAVDIWSIGVLFAEIAMNGIILFNSQTNLEQLQKICNLRGTPNEQNWPGCTKLPQFIEFEERKAEPLNQLITPDLFPEEGVKLIEKCLTLDPNQRPTCEQLLNSEIMKNTPDVDQTNLPELAKQWWESKLNQNLS